VWLASAPKEPFAIPGVVAMELLAGCRSQGDLERVKKFLERFTVLWPEASEFARAYELLAAVCLTSGLSIPDCLIAAMAVSRNAALYTFNVKHFRAIPGLTAQQPYARI
jgi:hypothetical protein